MVKRCFPSSATFILLLSTAVLVTPAASTVFHKSPRPVDDDVNSSLDTFHPWPEKDPLANSLFLATFVPRCAQSIPICSVRTRIPCQTCCSCPITRRLAAWGTGPNSPIRKRIRARISPYRLRGVCLWRRRQLWPCIRGICRNRPAGPK